MNASSGKHPQVGVFVPNQTVYEFRSAAEPATARSASPVLTSNNVISICDLPGFSGKVSSESVESNPDGLGCARGLRSAFLLEAGMLALAYGIWHFIHLAH